MRIDFEQNADNVGEVDSEGAVVKWPTRDCYGRALSNYSRTNVTTKRIDATHFAIIPVGGDDGDMQFAWKQGKSAVKAKDAE